MSPVSNAALNLQTVPENDFAKAGSNSIALLQNWTHWTLRIPPNGQSVEFATILWQSTRPSNQPSKKACYVQVRLLNRNNTFSSKVPALQGHLRGRASSLEHVTLAPERRVS